MKRHNHFFGMNLAAAAAALSLALPVSSLLAQATGSIHGHVQNYAGVAVTAGEVRLSTDRSNTDAKSRKYAYTLPISSTGEFKGDNIAPGDYVLFYFDQDKLIDYLEHVVVKAGQDTAQNDDMTRPEFVAKLTPEEKKALENFKKTNGTAQADNAKIANVNTLLNKARTEMQAKDYATALTDMQQAVSVRPDEALVQLEYGNALQGTGKFDDAVTAYKKAIDLNTASKKPSIDVTAVAYNQLGTTYAKLKKPKDAGDAFDKAAQAQPARAGVYYFNEAAILLNAEARDEAAAAADKAIAADPTRADAYYIKGQALIGKSTVDAKSQKIVPPPGCLEAYEKYLDLAPTGAHAAEVKQLISAFDEKVVTSYKARKK